MLMHAAETDQAHADEDKTFLTRRRGRSSALLQRQEFQLVLSRDCTHYHHDPACNHHHHHHHQQQQLQQSHHCSDNAQLNCT